MYEFISEKLARYFNEIIVNLNYTDRCTYLNNKFGQKPNKIKDYKRKEYMVLTKKYSL